MAGADDRQRVLVTGANGFVGGALMGQLRRQPEIEPRGLVRPGSAANAAQPLTIGPELGPDGDWRPALAGVNAIVHAAARVHVAHDEEVDPLAAYRWVNRDGTLALARQAAACGVRRFVFLSTIKVNGERTEGRRAFRADDAPTPQDAYAISKHEAEKGLFRMGAETGMEIVVIRPPLVYGPGVKANMRAMMAWLQRGAPLPFAAVDNRRSLISLGNLVDLVIRALGHPSAAGHVLLAGDGEELSTPDLLRRAAAALGARARLFPVPPGLLRAGARILGRQAAAARLLDSLRVDISQTCRLLDWTPPDTVDAGLAAMARDYLKRAG